MPVVKIYVSPNHADNQTSCKARHLLNKICFLLEEESIIFTKKTHSVDGLCNILRLHFIAILSKLLLDAEVVVKFSGISETVV